MDKNMEILGYYVEDDSIALELKLTNIPDIEDKILDIHFSKRFVKWMHEEFDRWSEREENQVEVEE